MASIGNGHVFISYVREDSEKVTRLEQLLRDAGIEVWRDTTALWPGMDWRSEIRRAITDDALVFLACISSNSVARAKSGQNEELVLAVEELRKRRPDQAWLIPVLFDDVEVPDLDVGGGRTLRSYQWIDLKGENWDQAGRLVASIVRILEPHAPGTRPSPKKSDVDAEIKAAIRDPQGEIAYHDLVMGLADVAAVQLRDEERFPSTSNELSGPAAQASLWVVSLVDQYMKILEDPIQVMITSGEWASSNHLRHLTRFVERLNPSSPGGAGMVVLTSLRWFPVLPILYAGVLAAKLTNNFSAIRAVTIDATVRDFQEGKLPLIARSHPFRPFQGFELVPQVLALRASGEEVSAQTVEELRTRRRGNRYTPVSDFLHDTLRPRFEREVPDDEDFDEMFDSAELLMDLIGLDLATQMSGERVYVDGPRFGRTTWRQRFMGNTSGPEHQILKEAQEAGDAWGPLQAGLFGSSSKRALDVIERLIPQYTEARSRRW